MMIKFFLFWFLLFSCSYAKAPSLEEMIAQMIVIGFDGEKEGDKWVEQIAKDIRRQKNWRSDFESKEHSNYFAA